jgi:hypothetical protein
MRWLLTCGLLLLAAPAWAGSQSFDWIVDPVPEIPIGTLKTTLIQSYVPDGHPGTQSEGEGAAAGSGPGTVATSNLIRTGIRGLYGLTDQIALMYQLNLAKPSGSLYQYEGSEFGTHFRFYEGHGWKLGGAIELEWQREPQYVDNALDLDIHPIIERDFGPISILLNPILEKNLVGPDSHAGLEASYAAQVLYHFSEHYSAGLESYGDKGRLTHGGSPSQNQDYYVMPVVNANFGSLNFSTGPGIGLTGASDRVVIKFNVGYSFAIFPRSLSPTAIGN